MIGPASWVNLGLHGFDEHSLIACGAGGLEVNVAETVVGRAREGQCAEGLVIE